ncbi:hypothetical protein NEHOM01_1733 [Nematocida homosporus]|uniref:uncharacterized protein n=1 Tax=Nematocida homosporus TaxID=1912981 RepID=UPI00221F3669|nr:uncharacterized protein NEHOM01_1733 [Nematocida homosporus]KAI5186832.1 hypothetical protein NEHOM01_1733 [Nematocida homosporus]
MCKFAGMPSRMENKLWCALLVHCVGLVLGLAFARTGYDRLGYLGIALVSSGLLFRVWYSDPGVLAKRNEDYKRRVKFADGAYVVLEEGGSMVGRIVTLGKLKQVEPFCTSCGIFRPEHAFHCRDCRRCIARMDHHCPWIGNCIGEKNYPDFMALLGCETLQGVYAIFLRLRYGWHSLEWSWPCFWFYAGLWVALLLFLLIFGLWGYFVILSAHGKTARAFCRERKGKKDVGV